MADTTTASCGHCHHGTRLGERVGWSPERRLWEACQSTNNPVGPVVQPRTTGGADA